MSITRVPGSHGELTFQGPALGRTYAVTLKGSVKWSPNGTVFQEIPDVHGEPLYMGKSSYGKIKFTPMTNQDLSFLRDMRAGTATWRSIGRVMVFTGCLLTQGDSLPEEDLVSGESDEVTVSFTGYAQDLKTD